VATEPPAIECRGLARHFGERTALREVTLEVPAGASLAVLGRNGAGKSTLLRIFASLLRPHAGEVLIFGEPLPRRAWAVRARLGLLGHEPLLYRLPPERVTEVLAAVGMDRRAEDPVRLLSRGMVQRLAIARAVLHRPQLLLLDEPRANLDPGASELVEPLIGRAAGVTRVLTSHDPRAALAEADLVLALKGGRPVFAGEPAAFDERRLAELYA
jgi:heme exporter protein A